MKPTTYMNPYLAGFLLGLVLLAAVFHATWNLLARRAEEKLAFLWCGTLVTLSLIHISEPTRPY